MGPIVGEKFFWDNCLSKTLCKSQPDRHIQKRGGKPKLTPIPNICSGCVGYLRKRKTPH